MTYRAEEWRAIPGWGGFYSVSSEGVVRSEARTIVRKNGSPMRCKELTLKSRPNEHGYPIVDLCRAGTKETWLVHQLVALAFIGPMPNGMETAHCDGVKANCSADNLRYATPKQNSADKFLHGTMQRGSEIGSAKLSESDIPAIRASGLSQSATARQYGVSQTLIGMIRRRVIWRHVS